MPVDMPVHYATQERLRVLCRVVDISCHGARLLNYVGLERGAIVRLSMPGLAARKAEIVWSDDYSAACKFDKPLSERDVAELAIRFGHVVEPDRPIEDMILVA